MKKLLLTLLFLFCITGANVTFATATSSTGKTISIESLQSQFPNFFVQEYIVSDLSKDITATREENSIYDNSIQALSKEKTWNSDAFSQFVSFLKEKKTFSAAKLYEKNWKIMSPFLPTCCSSKEYISTRAVENGIISLVTTTQAEMGYAFEYIFYSEWSLYSIQSNSYFSEYQQSPGDFRLTYNTPSRSILIKRGKVSEFSKKYMISWLKSGSVQLKTAYSQFVRSIKGL